MQGRGVRTMKYSLEPAMLLIVVGALILTVTCSFDPVSAWVGFAVMAGGVGLIAWGAIEDFMRRKTMECDEDETADGSAPADRSCLDLE
jgi:hypothetical protein